MSRASLITSSAILTVLLVSLALSGCARTPEARARQHMDRGLVSLKRNSFRKAVIEFKVASQNTPSDPEPLYQLGMACLGTRDGRCAVESFEKALRLRENHEGAMYQLARLQGGANEPVILSSAAEMLGRLLREHPANQSARYVLAMVEIKLGRTEEALSTYDAALTSSTNTIDDIRLPIRTAVDRKDLDLARLLVTRAMARLPKSAELATTSAVVATLAGQRELAAAETARALSLNPALRPALQLEMRQELANNQPDRADATARRLAALPGAESRTAHADLLAAQGKRDESLKEYEALRSRFPDDKDVQLRYVSLLIRTQHGPQARAELDRLIKKDPKRGDLLVIRTGLSLDEGKTDEAGKDIVALGELKARSPSFSFEKARYRAARGEKKQEGEALTEALQLNPRMMAARIQLARLLTEMGKPALALDTLNGASAQERATPQFALYRSVALMASGDWAEARKAVDVSLQHGRSVEALVQDTALRMHAGDLAGAEKSTQEVLQKDPGARPALAQMGAIWQAKKQAPAYLKWIEQHADRNPGVSSLQLFAGELLRDNENLPAARRMLERAEKSDSNGQAAVDLALLEIREGKLDNARTRLEGAIRNRDTAFIRSILADVYRRKSDLPNAEEQLRAAIHLAPADSKDMMSLATVISNNPKRLDEAVVYAEKALAVSPGNPAVESSAGWLYYRTKRYPNAVTHLTAALKTADSSSTRYRLAAACMMAGDRECATNQYQKAVQQNPKDPTRSDAAPLLEGRAR